MKSPQLALSFFFFAFFAKPFSEASTPVFDSNGEKVVTGTEYYMLSTVHGPEGGGGLNLFNNKNETCAVDVIQEELDMLKGLPLRFSYAHEEEEEEVVYASTDVNIKFSNTESTCNKPTTVWKVDHYDRSTGQWFITNDGLEGDPGAETLQSWFKCEMVGLNVYRITHCPSVCDSCVTLCGDIGIYSLYGVRRLALSHFPLTLVFVKRGINATN